MLGYLTIPGMLLAAIGAIFGLTPPPRGRRHARGLDAERARLGAAAPAGGRIRATSQPRSCRSRASRRSAPWPSGTRSPAARGRAAGGARRRRGRRRCVLPGCAIRAPVLADPGARRTPAPTRWGTWRRRARRPGSTPSRGEIERRGGPYPVHVGHGHGLHRGASSCASTAPPSARSAATTSSRTARARSAVARAGSQRGQRGRDEPAGGRAAPLKLVRRIAGSDGDAVNGPTTSGSGCVRAPSQAGRPALVALIVRLLSRPSWRPVALLWRFPWFVDGRRRDLREAGARRHGQSSSPRRTRKASWPRGSAPR